MKHKYVYMFIVFSVALQAVKALAIEVPVRCESTVLETPKYVKTREFGTKPLIIYVDTDKKVLTVFEKPVNLLGGILSSMLLQKYSEAWTATLGLQDIPITASRSKTMHGTFTADSLIKIDNVSGDRQNFRMVHVVDDIYIRTADSSEQCLINEINESQDGNILVPATQMEEIYNLVETYGIHNTEIQIRPRRQN